MKNQLAEDLDLSLPEGWTEVGLEKGPSLEELVITDEDAIGEVHKAVQWARVLEMADRREAAAKDMPVCEKCGTVQVQLVSWSTPTLAYKCRSCKHRFERKAK